MSHEFDATGKVLFQSLIEAWKQDDEISIRLQQAVSSDEVHLTIEELRANQGRRETILEIAQQLGINLDDFANVVLEGEYRDITDILLLE